MKKRGKRNSGERNICKEILTQIYVAQLASDAGKGIFELPFDIKGGERAIRDAYAEKYRALDRAEKSIKENPDCGVKLETKVIYQNKGKLQSYRFTIKREKLPDLVIMLHKPLPVRKGHYMRVEAGTGGDHICRNRSREILEMIRAR